MVGPAREQKATPQQSDSPDLSLDAIEVAIEPDQGGLVSYAAKYGLVLEELEPEQVMVLIAARGVEKYVRDLKIPMSERSVDSGRKVLVEKEVERTIERTTYREGEKPADVPADRMDLAALESPEKLADLVPSEWLTEEVAPEIFLKKLRERSLLRRDWREPTRTPLTSHETIKEKVVVEEPAPPEVQKQHACVLLDISGSMYESGDGRNVVASGLALAFLRNGFEQRARLGLRFFNGDTSHLMQGSGFEDLREMARKVLAIDWGGGTDIQGALDIACTDIKKGGSFTRADILLITDGLSWLTRNPLDSIKLHTFLLGIGSREARSDGARQAISTLKSWSATLKRFSSSKFAGIMLPSEKDLDELTQSIRSIPDGLSELTSSEQQLLLTRRIAGLQRVLNLINAASDDSNRRMSAVDRLRAMLVRRRLSAMQKELSEISEELQKVSAADIEHNRGRKEARARAEQAQQLAAEEQRRAAHAAKEAEAARELERMLMEMREREPAGKLKDSHATEAGSGSGTAPGRAGIKPHANSPQPRDSSRENDERQMSLWERLRRWFDELRSNSARQHGEGDNRGQGQYSGDAKIEKSRTGASPEADSPPAGRT